MAGTKNARTVKAVRSFINRINELDGQYKSLSDAELGEKTAEFRRRVSEGETLDDIMCEAFAVVKNCSRRLLGTEYQVCGRTVKWEMVPFDVQLIGGIALHRGGISEMATGEGKTLVATMPAYLNALSGRGVHIVTVNDYLARRDAEWMGLLYERLGVTVGCIQNDMDPAERREQYSMDITYGTNSEFGFDYLRDNGMATRAEDQVQRDHFYAIIDEVDSILIDEARTPLIISGPVAESSHQYKELRPKVDALVRKQRELVNRYMMVAREHLEKGEDSEAQPYLYRVHQGMPKHKQFMHMLEEPATRRLLERIEDTMLTDMHKDEARALREELYFVIDEKGHDASLTEKGCEALNPSDPEGYVLPDLVTATADIEANEELSEDEKLKRRSKIQEDFMAKSERIQNVDQLIRAYCMYEKDVQYVVQNNRVFIVDEFTGRILPGRRWSDGLHQAVEAKEGVEIERETQTLATITIQNYFRMYDKLAGMTGTAETEASEFHETYGLDVVVMPTNRPVRRLDFDDRIYKTQREKYRAIIEDIADCHERGQPVLVGTISVETSELIGRMLKRAKIPHNVLNAKQHASEAEIVARAGEKGTVTIATNMAGRGTDIKLGEGVVQIARPVVESDIPLDGKVDGKTLRDILVENPCGLYVIGSERHEARRIDRQLRGRCARQGDPGVSRFYVSLEDDLMRLFGSDRIAGILDRLGLEEGQVLEHRWLNRSIETAQKRVEQQNFAIRKRTLEYDDVMNKQRKIVYGMRGEIVRNSNVREQLYDLIWDVVNDRTASMLAERSEEAAKAFADWVLLTFPVAVRQEEFRGVDPEPAADKLFGMVKSAYELKIRTENPNSINEMERHIMLHAIDSRWQDYLRAMDGLRQGVGLRAYGQQDPLIEYKREAFGMFETLMADIKEEVASKVFRSSTSLDAFRQFVSSLPKTLVHDEVAMLGGRTSPTGPMSRGGDPGGGPEAMPRVAAPVKRETAKVGRNDPCPCGSGRKYKKCCGAAQ
jgi:preprotein translocase subunit SecA